jgi:hypothetical protein
MNYNHIVLQYYAQHVCFVLFRCVYVHEDSGNFVIVRYIDTQCTCKTYVCFLRCLLMFRIERDKRMYVILLYAVALFFLMFEK